MLQSSQTEPGQQGQQQQQQQLDHTDHPGAHAALNSGEDDNPPYTAHPLRRASTLRPQAQPFRPGHSWHDLSSVEPGPSALPIRQGTEQIHGDSFPAQAPDYGYSEFLWPFGEGLSEPIGFDNEILAPGWQHNGDEQRPVTPSASYRTLVSTPFEGSQAKAVYQTPSTDPHEGLLSGNSFALDDVDQQLASLNAQPQIDRLLKEASSRDDPNRVTAVLQTWSLPSSSTQIGRPLTARSQASSRFTCDCHVCGKTFETRSKMNHHARCHKADHEKSFPCPPCGVSFIFGKDLERHRNTKKHRRQVQHVGNAPLQLFYCPAVECPVHQQGMTRKDNLERHKKSKHPELRPA